MPSDHLDDRCDLSEGPSNRVEPPAEKGGCGRLIGRTKAGANTKMHALTDRNGKPLRYLLSAVQVSGYTGATDLFCSFPEADFLLADRGYDAD